MRLPDRPTQPLLAGPSAATRPLGRVVAGTVRLLPALGIMAASRIVGFFFVYAGGWFRPAYVPKHVGYRLADPFADGSLLDRLFQPFANWDGTWYIRIASQGYHKIGSWAFFPLYPWLLHGTADATDGQYVVAGMMLSIAAALAAAAVLYLLVEEDYGRRVALWAVAFLAFFPTSIFLQAVYTESLFLLAALACVLWARRGRWKLAGLAGMLAALTRNTGVLLLIPLLAFYGSSINWRWRQLDRRVLWSLLIPAGLGVYMAYQLAVRGNPFLFNDSQELWRRQLASPFTSLYHGATDSLILLHRLLLHGSLYPAAVHNLIAFPLLVLAVAALVLAWRRLRPAYLAYAAAAILLPLCYPSVQRPLFSMPRFLLTCFPVFIALALLTEHRPKLRFGVLALFAGGYLFLTIEFTRLVFIS
jgi:4-amino-4-deoxy-L-arabinose transferase-like glycosyltransferase